MSKVREALKLSQSDNLPPGIAKSSHNVDKIMLNLKELNRIIMIEAGILPVHIEYSMWCTSCHPDKFFSYRGQNGVTGRMASWIGMKVR
jgi:copper oxidase (laccase) domain-containing protein